MHDPIAIRRTYRSSFVSTFVWIVFACLLIGCGSSDGEEDVFPAATAGTTRETPPSTELSPSESSSTETSSVDSSRIDSSRIGSSTSSSSNDGSTDASSVGTESSPTAANQGTAPTPRTRAIDLNTASLSQLREVTLTALESGQDDLAFDVVRKAIRRAPEDPEIVYLHAMILADRNRFREAVSILDGTAQKVPQSRLPFLGQTAEWMAEAGEFTEAESRYRQILSVAPDEPRVHHFLGQLLLQRGRRIESAVHFRFLGRLGDLNQEELRSLLVGRQSFPKDEADGRLVPLSDLASARQAIADGNPNLAIELLTNAEDSSSKSLLARLQSQQGKWDVVREWESSFTPSDFDADGWYAKAARMKHDEDFKGSLESVARAVLIDPTDGEAYVLLADVAERAGQTEVAKRARERSDQLQRTMQLGGRIVGENPENRKLVMELIALLRELRRPMEVLGWRSVDLVYGVQDGSLSNQQAQQLFESIGRERMQMLGSGANEATTEFILCGLPWKNAPTQ